MWAGEGDTTHLGRKKAGRETGMQLRALLFPVHRSLRPKRLGARKLRLGLTTPTCCLLLDYDSPSALGFSSARETEDDAEEDSLEEKARSGP